MQVSPVDARTAPRNFVPGDLRRPISEFDVNEGLSLGKLLADAATTIQSNQFPSSLPHSPSPSDSTRLSSTRKSLRRASNAVVMFLSRNEDGGPAFRMLQAIGEQNNSELTAIFEVRHPWLCTLLAAALTDQLHPPPPVCDCQLSALDEWGIPSSSATAEIDEGRARSRDLAISIGQSLPYFLSATSNVGLAVNDWIRHYPALVELSGLFPWFSSLVEMLISTSDADSSSSVERYLACAFGLKRQALDLLKVAKEDKSGDLTLLLLHLGRQGNKRRTLLSLFVPYIVVGSICAIPLNSAFSGFEENATWTWLVFPLMLITASSMVVGGTALVSKSYAVLASLSSPKLALRLRSKLLLFGAVLVPALWTYPVSVCLERFVAFPFPWTNVVLASCCPAIVIFVFTYLHRCHREKAASLTEMKNTLTIILVLLIPLGIYLPFSTSFYLALDGYPQLAFVAFSAALRGGVVFGMEIMATSTRWKISDFSLIAMLLLLELFYETYSSTLLSKADFYATLALPPLFDAVGNVFIVVYILVYLKGNQEQQVVQLIALALREFIEVSSSIGVMGIFAAAWQFNKPNYFMIDVTTSEELRRGLLTSFLSFLSEIIGLFIFDRVVHKVFRVSLVELGVAFVSTVGHIEFFCVCTGATMYILFVLVYHAGSDFYFRFEWMKKENDNDPLWCDLKQQSQSSCFYK